MSKKMFLVGLALFLFIASASAFDTNGTDVNVTGGGTEALYEAFDRGYAMPSYIVGVTSTYGHINRASVDVNAVQATTHTPVKSLVEGIALVINIVTETITNDWLRVFALDQYSFGYVDNNAGNFMLAQDDANFNGSSEAYADGININTTGVVSIPLDSNALSAFRTAVSTDVNWSIGVTTNEATSGEYIDANILAMDVNFDSFPRLLITALDGSDDALPLMFSNSSDGNITVSFNVREFDDGNPLNHDVNFNLWYGQGCCGAGKTNAIVLDLNVDTGFCLTDLNTDSNSFCDWDWPIAGLADGNYWVVGEVRNDSMGVGAYSDTNATGFATGVLVDNTAPSTSLTQDGETITLACTDSTAGCATTYYKINRGGWQTYSEAFTISYGQNEISFYSVDRVGNTESTSTGTFTTTSLSSSACNMVNLIQLALAALILVTIAVFGLLKMELEPKTMMMFVSAAVIGFVSIVIIGLVALC